MVLPDGIAASTFITTSMSHAMVQRSGIRLLILGCDDHQTPNRAWSTTAAGCLDLLRSLRIGMSRKECSRAMMKPKSRDAVFGNETAATRLLLRRPSPTPP